MNEENNQLIFILDENYTEDDLLNDLADMKPIEPSHTQQTVIEWVLGKIKSIKPRAHQLISTGSDKRRQKKRRKKRR